MSRDTFDFKIVLSDEVPRDAIGFVCPATEDDIRRGKAVRVPGTKIWLNPRQCGVITNIGDDVKT